MVHLLRKGHPENIGTTTLFHDNSTMLATTSHCCGSMAQNSQVTTILDSKDNLRASEDKTFIVKQGVRHSFVTLNCYILVGRDNNTCRFGVIYVRRRTIVGARCVNSRAQAESGCGWHVGYKVTKLVHGRKKVTTIKYFTVSRACRWSRKSWQLRGHTSSCTYGGSHTGHITRRITLAMNKGG